MRQVSHLFQRTDMQLIIPSAQSAEDKAPARWSGVSCNSSPEMISATTAPATGAGYYEEGCIQHAAADLDELLSLSRAPARSP